MSKKRAGATKPPRGPAAGFSHTVAPEDAGCTVAALLHRHGGLSHRRAKGILQAGLVTVDGAAVTDPAHRPPAGARLQARFDPETRYRPRRVPPTETPWYRVRLQDPDFLVVEKAAGVLSQPAGRCDGRSLVERLLAAEPPAAQRRGLFLVHRIDRDVSGLVVVARSPAAFASLQRQFAARNVLRQYVALAIRTGLPDAGRLDTRLTDLGPGRPVRSAAAGEEGVRAVLDYRVLERLPRACLLEVRLTTGKRHQIRAQLAGLGHPLVGDRLYGAPSPLLGRVALHAQRLEFLHPRTGVLVTCESPIPGDFQAALQHLRAGEHPLERGVRPPAPPPPAAEEPPEPAARGAAAPPVRRRPPVRRKTNKRQKKTNKKSKNGSPQRNN